MMQRSRISSFRSSIFLLHLLHLAALISPTIEAGNFSIPEEPLYDDGTTSISSGGGFELGFCSPAGSGRRYISQTTIDGRSGGRLSHSGEGLTDPEATLFDDRNFAGREAGNDGLDSFAWQSFDFPTDTLLVGMAAPQPVMIKLRPKSFFHHEESNLTKSRISCSRTCPCKANASSNVDVSNWTTPNESSGRSHLAVMVAVPALAIFLLVCIAYVCKRWKRKNCVVVKEMEEKDLYLPLFDLDTVLAATSNFAAENKLGQGGFGPVYKGKLVDGQEIAVKRLSKTSTQGINEFKNEALIIPKLQHQNLIRLLGCCIQEGERMLIYEYMPKGTLDAFLFDEAKRILLDWKTRYNIIVGIARGLLYLHRDSRVKIIHRDLKTSNILLDKDNVPKISDFGLARTFKDDEMEINTRRVVGTYGYMSPEYAMNGFFSIKSDVFSFGVLILEIVSGKKNRVVYNSSCLNLVGHIWSLWKEGKSLQIVDESIGHSFSAVEVMRCIKIGLLCVQERPQERPTMPLIVIMLDSDSPIPEPKQPGFVTALDSSQHLLSINDVSNTTLEGR